MARPEIIIHFKAYLSLDEAKQIRADWDRLYPELSMAIVYGDASFYLNGMPIDGGEVLYPKSIAVLRGKDVVRYLDRQRV